MAQAIVTSLRLKVFVEQLYNLLTIYKYKIGNLSCDPSFFVNFILDNYPKAILQIIFTTMR